MERVAAIPAGKDSGMPTGLLQTAGQMQHHGGLARASYRNIADADDGNSKAAAARDLAGMIQAGDADPEAGEHPQEGETRLRRPVSRHMPGKDLVGVSDRQFGSSLAGACAFRRLGPEVRRVRGMVQNIGDRGSQSG